MLSCGHTFCSDCIQNWFATAYAKHLEYQPSYNPQTLVPANFREQLTDPMLPAFLRRDLIRQIVITVGSTTHPNYSCPTCRLSTSVKPAENFVIKNLVRIVADARKEAVPERPPQPLEGPFHKFFPWTQWLG